MAKPQKEERKGITYFRPGMHYATLTALVISNVTVLALAVLVAGPFFGGSLGIVAETASTLHTQEVRAAARKALNTPRPPLQDKELYEVTAIGYVTGMIDPQDVINDSVQPPVYDSVFGDLDLESSTKFAFSFVFDALQDDDNPNPVVGSYDFNGSDYPMQIAVGNYSFDTSLGLIDVQNWSETYGDYYSADTYGSLFESNDLLGQWMYLVLTDFVGDAIDSDELPTFINLSEWSSEQVFGVGYGDPEMSGFGWQIDGQVLSLKVLPIHDK